MTGDNRNRFLAIVLLVGMLHPAAPSIAAGEDRPNILLIMTDDQGNNVGFQGNPHVTTPHIDRLAEQSVRLTNFHQMPMCTASRAGLMSGQYAERTGAWRTSLGRTMMRGDTYTIAEAFKAGGYATGQFGKWHLGDNWPMRPQDQGFDDVVFSGRSFKPYLENPLDPEDDDRTVFFYYFNPKKLDQRENQNCVIWKNWRLLAGKNLYDFSKDRMQENDVAAEYPEVVEKLNARFDAYHAHGKTLVQEPVRFILGDPQAPKVELTSQDVYWTKDKSGSQAFGQSDATNLKQAHGPYKVSLARSGKYTFKLSRYPLYTELPLGTGGRKMEKDFAIEKVRISIAGQTVEKAVTPEDTHASFTLELKEGDADLETSLIGDGKNGVAYFVTVEFED